MISPFLCKINAKFRMFLWVGNEREGLILKCKLKKRGWYCTIKKVFTKPNRPLVMRQMIRSFSKKFIDTRCFSILCGVDQVINLKFKFKIGNLKIFELEKKKNK